MFSGQPQEWDETKNAFEEIQAENLKIKNKKIEAEEPPSSKPQTVSRQSPETNSHGLQSYLSGVIYITCGSISGSGTLWDNSGEYSVLTNAHVVAKPNLSGYCMVQVETASNVILGMYRIFPQTIKKWNDLTDVAVLKIFEKEETKICDPDGLNCLEYKPIPSLNYSISRMPFCQSKMPIGSPVLVVGYPAFGEKDLSVGTVSSRIVTNGIISGYDDTVSYPLGELPNPNYYVSNKIDSGNSRGIAFSNNGSSLCILGIPTWLSIGNFEAGGLIQDINMGLAQKIKQYFSVSCKDFDAHY